MKWMLILLLWSCSARAQSKVTKNVTTTNRKIDSFTVVQTSTNTPARYQDTTFIIVDKLSETFKKTDTFPWDKVLPSLLAFFTVLVSSGVALYIGVRNSRTQIESAEKQINMQFSIAQEQLTVSRAQITQTAKNTLEQARATILSQARIAWLNDLRKLLAKYINLSGIISEQIQELKTTTAIVENIELKAAIDNNLNEHRALQAEIFMYLNVKEKVHEDLQISMIELFNAMADPKEQKINEKIASLLVRAQDILKATWEQAKSEVINMKS